MNIIVTDTYVGSHSKGTKEHFLCYIAVFVSRESVILSEGWEI